MGNSEAQHMGNWEALGLGGLCRLIQTCLANFASRYMAWFMDAPVLAVSSASVVQAAAYSTFWGCGLQSSYQ